MRLNSRGEGDARAVDVTLSSLVHLSYVPPILRCYLLSVATNTNQLAVHGFLLVRRLVRRQSELSRTFWASRSAHVGSDLFVSTGRV